jgi:hypothetical protein
MILWWDLVLCKDIGKKIAYRFDNVKIKLSVVIQIMKYDLPSVFCSSPYSPFLS